MKPKQNYDRGDVKKAIVAETIRAVARNNSYDCGKVYGTVSF